MAALSAAGLGSDTHFTFLSGSTPYLSRKMPASALVLAELAPPIDPESALATCSAGLFAVRLWALANFLLTTRPSGLPRPSVETASCGRPLARADTNAVGLLS